MRRLGLGVSNQFDVLALGEGGDPFMRRIGTNEKTAMIWNDEFALSEEFESLEPL
jgi:hypothetical protein